MTKRAKPASPKDEALAAITEARSILLETAFLTPLRIHQAHATLGFALERVSAIEELKKKRKAKDAPRET